MELLPLCACGCGQPLKTSKYTFLLNHRWNDWQSRFWANVEKTDTCWLWTGYMTGPTEKYGYITVHGKSYRAHRLAWEIAYGPIQDDLLVCHHCDVRRCVNPEHLFLGTQTDNLRDCFNKGRSPMNKDLSRWRLKGEDNHKTTLKSDEIRAIRSSQKTVKELSIEYHVTLRTIYNIIQRKTWRHLL